MTTETKTYNGWTNYETWAVKLWMDNNDYAAYLHWREVACRSWELSEDLSPNRFMDRSANARNLLAEQLKDEHSEHPVFAVANGSVYADLLNAALSEVNWLEIANSLLRSAELEGYKEWDS